MLERVCGSAGLENTLAIVHVQKEDVGSYLSVGFWCQAGVSALTEEMLREEAKRALEALEAEDDS